MTVEMKVPSHSGKKVYEEASTLYEQKKSANIFNSDFGYGELNEEWDGGKHRKLADYDEQGNEINKKDPDHAGKAAKYRTYHNSEYNVIGMHRLGDDGKVAKGGTPYHHEVGFDPHVRGKNVDGGKEDAVNEMEHTIRSMAKTKSEGVELEESKGIRYAGKGEGNGDKSSPAALSISSIPGDDEHKISHWDGTKHNHVSTHSSWEGAVNAIIDHHHSTGIPVDSGLKGIKKYQGFNEETAAARTIKGKKNDDCSCDTKKFSMPTGLTGPLASMFGVHTQAAPAAPVKHDNDRTKPETQEYGKVATPDDLAIKLHSSLPGMTRKAISMNHIIAALKAGIKAPDIQRMAHSAVGRRHIRDAGGSPYNFSEHVSEMMNAWTIELVQEGSSHKYIVRDEDDIIAEGVNLTSDAAMKSAARSIEELGASLEEQAIALSEEKEHDAARPSRILSAVRSIITK